MNEFTKITNDQISGYPQDTMIASRLYKTYRAWPWRTLPIKVCRNAKKHAKKLESVFIIFYKNFIIFDKKGTKVKLSHKILSFFHQNTHDIRQTNHDFSSRFK